MHTFRGAISALRDLQKTARGVSFYSRWVNRPGGRLFAATAYVLRLTPNQVSLASGALTLVGAVLIATAPPSVGVGILVWLLLAFGFMVDSADGQLARLRGGGTRAGEWLDHVLDAGKVVAVHSAVLVAWDRFFDLPQAMLLIPLGFQFAAVVAFVAGTLTELLKRTSSASAAVRPPSNLRALLLVPVDYGIFCIVFIAYGFPAVFVVIYTVFAVIRVVYLILFLAKWFKELSNL